MPKLPCISGKEAVKALGKLGFEFRRQNGSHAVLKKENRGCVVPMHKEINQGTLRGILRQAGVSEEELKQVL